jgi:hypothetical protein
VACRVRASGAGRQQLAELEALQAFRLQLGRQVHEQESNDGEA